MKIKYKCKIILEIPTYPYDQETVVTFSDFLVIRKEIKYRERLKGIVDRIVTFSNDLSIWGIPTINISNGVDISKITPIKSNTINEINMIAVASHNFWHGYDRLIKGMVNYQGKKNMTLHVVGDGPSIAEYKKLVEENGLREKVIFYGNLMGEKLDSVYDKCNLGIDALARHRSDVYFNSSLKGKEYCAKGLPIVSGVETELDYDPAYSFYFRVPADETVIDMEQVIEFYEKVYTNSQEEVIRKIREYAEEHFDTSKVILPIIEYLKET